MPEYSVNAPATSSDSASGISKGVRLHSAIPLMKKMKKATNVKGLLNINQLGKKPQIKPLWYCIIPCILIVLVSIITAIIDSATGIS